MSPTDDGVGLGRPYAQCERVFFYKSKAFFNPQNKISSLHILSFMKKPRGEKVGFLHKIAITHREKEKLVHETVKTLFIIF